jgi:hypothetical protein
MDEKCKAEGKSLMDCLADASVANLGSQGSDDEFDDSLEPGQLNGPSMITFDGDQTLYSDGSNFEDNPHLANYLFQLLRHGVHIAVVTAAGYEYNVEKYEHRLSGLLEYFRDKGMTEEECSRFYLFGGECNFLLHVSVICTCVETCLMVSVCWIWLFPYAAFSHRSWERTIIFIPLESLGPVVG